MFTRMIVVFKEDQVITLKRSELYKSTDFLANCGGLLGLFLGVSFMSILEIFYFCTVRLYCNLKKQQKLPATPPIIWVNSVSRSHY
jgi:acid-sensing ion channel, other